VVRAESIKRQPVGGKTIRQIRQRFMRDSSVSRKTSFKAVQQLKILLYLESVIIVYVL
jgi:hypothetical protein